MAKKLPGQLLRNYIDENEKNVETFARKLGAGVASVYRWIKIAGPRSLIVRLAIEKETGGKVPAKSWPKAKTRWTGHKKAKKNGGKSKDGKSKGGKTTKRSAKPAAKPAKKRKPATKAA